jgi:putative nucleotidyltransferase with HDIG domain
MASPATARSQSVTSDAGGRGRVLAAAFAEAERIPALVTAREKALESIARGAVLHDIAGIVESDVGLTIAVVRAAGALQGDRVRSVPEAVERLGSRWVEEAVRSVPSYDPFTPQQGYAVDPDRFRVHAVLVQRAADRVCEVAGFTERDEVALAAILHDIGRPAVARLHPGYAERFDPRGGTSDDRVTAERRELGIDHALVGGVLARRWGLHARVAEAIERHHAEKAEGAGAVLRVADMLALYMEECPLSFQALIEAAEHSGLGEAGLRRVLYELPQGNGGKRRSSGPCPLSARELDVLRRLAEGKVYKQIAQDLDLSASTVRSHLHNVYGKLGALDRAQAVLIATDRGWI